jgi:pimeloyl-ACP methyl ester carboxylesterase
MVCGHRKLWKDIQLLCAIHRRSLLQTAGCGEPVLLVHGFGASHGQWRKNIPELAKTHKVCELFFLAGSRSLLHNTRSAALRLSSGVRA